MRTHGFDALEIFLAASYSSLLIATLRLSQYPPCSFPPRLALSTLFLNFVAATVASPTHELTGPYTKFHETCFRVSKEEAHADPIGTTGSVVAFLSRGGMIYSESGAGNVHSVALKAQPAPKW